MAWYCSCAFWWGNRTYCIVRSNRSKYRCLCYCRLRRWHHNNAYLL